MAWGRTKTDRSGPKRGKGHWGHKADAKQAAKRSRRREDHESWDHGDTEELALEAGRRTLRKSPW